MSTKNIKLEQQLITQLKATLVASCQPVDNGPMDKVEHVVAMALAAIDGGAKAIRIEGVANVKAVASVTDTPIVGIVKRDLDDSAVRISPFVQDIKDLAAAGATIIAFDGTNRKRPVPALELLNAVHDAGCIAMADCSEYNEGMALHQSGCTFIGSTMSGYIDLNNTPEQPDYQLVSDWVAQGLNVIAEGRYNSPQRAAKAIELGALCVTVGSAITRVEHITSWFVNSIEQAKG